ncbi:LysR family transcriptional regulator [Acidithiobacillus sp. HP-6]|uniref:LysR family transcriptional regulator n=1 Tax=unclassified Acidithiobacillus TaxID=2614800 RepID=UPI00187A20DC|nr:MULTISPECIES: LysR family transcriptional regulator [unclassified Acidithiobacillus]MBE7562486.1 LysR family transcriptional regulator [Acidithiobacillus sp. HP-6]MBE7569340.1 LysR family transcriptional regulator [Acidithiobacillus sp. HP-2]
MRNLDDLIVFIRVVDCASFSAAARSLNLTPTTVSKQIARLEKQLNIGLFERSTRQIKITDEGRAIAERVRPALALLDEAAEIARVGSAELSGIIRITAPIPFGSRYVAAATAAFRKLHPKVGFELYLTDRIINLYAGDVDVAFRVAHLNDSQLIVRRFGNNRRILAASPEYLKRSGMPGHPKDLTKHTCLLFSYPGLLQNNWNLHSTIVAAEEVISVNSNLVTDSGDTLRTWCVEGLGISLRERWDIADEIRTGRLIHVLPDWEEQAKPINFIRPRRHPTPKRISAFSEFLADLWRIPPWEY